MRSLVFLTAFIAGVLLCAGQSAAATNCQANLLFMSSLFCEGEALHWVHVDYRGSAEKIGLKEASLDEFLRETMPKSFPFFRQESIPISAIYKMPLEQRIKRGLFLCTVWTVGEDYPIAYHIICNLLGYGDNNSMSANLLKQEFLGIASKDSIIQALKTNLGKAADDIGATFLEYREKGSMEASK